MMPRENANRAGHSGMKDSDVADLKAALDAVAIPAGSAHAAALKLMAVSPQRFHARWELQQDAVDTARNIAAANPEASSLVLRAFDLPAGSDDFSAGRAIQDYPIQGPRGSEFFDLPYAAASVGGVVGMTNRRNQFNPLVRAAGIHMPAPPAAADAGEAGGTKEIDSAAPVPGRPPPLPAMDEAEVCARLDQVPGLPDELKHNGDAIRVPATRSGTAEPIAMRAVPAATMLLDEHAVVDAVRRKLAQNPDPDIEFSASLSNTNGTAPAPTRAGASEQLASQWATMWTGAPVELHAHFILSGKIAHGLRLLLGGEPVQPGPGGFFTWRRNLKTFDQVWPLLRPALEAPVVAALPALEFFNSVREGNRLLEMEAAIEIEGRIADPEQIAHLPAAIQPDAEGVFRITRNLPSGAVILPALALVADD